MADLLEALPFVQDAGPKLSMVRVRDLSLGNCLGIAAGIYRTGENLSSLYKLNCGHVEVGTLTDPGQLRIAEGVLTGQTRIGINIGSATSGFSDGVFADYRACLAAALPHADYIVLNFSNDAALRSLRSKAALDIVVQARRQVEDYASSQARMVALLAKVPAGFCGESMPVPPALEDQLDGLVAVGDSVDRLAELRSALPHHVIVSVGGVLTGADVRARRRAGADLVQVNRAFSQGGAAQIALILRELDHGIANE
jgi:dihydroorotate dehydrogenase